MSTQTVTTYRHSHIGKTIDLCARHAVPTDQAMMRLFGGIGAAVPDSTRPGECRVCTVDAPIAAEIAEADRLAADPRATLHHVHISRRFSAATYALTLADALRQFARLHRQWPHGVHSYVVGPAPDAWVPVDDDPSGGYMDGGGWEPSVHLLVYARRVLTPMRETEQ